MVLFGHHIGTLADALHRHCKRVQPGLNWRCGALHHGWLFASETTLGANRLCADLMREANEKRTDLYAGVLACVTIATK